MGRNFIFIWLLTANLYRTAVWWVLKAGKVGSVIKFLINYVISPIRLVMRGMREVICGWVWPPTAAVDQDENCILS